MTDALFLRHPEREPTLQSFQHRRPRGHARHARAVHHDPHERQDLVVVLARRQHPQHEQFLEKAEALRLTCLVDVRHVLHPADHLQILLGELERRVFKLHIAGTVRQHEPEIDMHNMPPCVDHDVAVMSVLDL